MGVQPRQFVNGADRSRLASMVMKLFDHWHLTAPDQLALLGLSVTHGDDLVRYRMGEPLAEDHDLLERVGMLMGIHASLRQLFPHNSELAYAWMTQSNKAFGGSTSVEVIKQEGLPGLRRVQTYLDHARLSG